jgi:hypothetical protein
MMPLSRRGNRTERIGTMNLELTADDLLDEYDGLGVEEIRNKYVAAMAKARRTDRGPVDERDRPSPV